MKQIAVTIALISMFCCITTIASHPGNENKAKVYIISPANGASVTSPVTIKFGLSGMGVAPAGVEQANTGHHHLLINLNKLPDLTQPLPATDNIKHFGGGQTEVTLNLPEGKHSLQLLLGNHLHIPHAQPVISEKITITVVSKK
jgi:hypothetical protein